jgi:5-methylcytosine-specific restriction protein A
MYLSLNQGMTYFGRRYLGQKPKEKLKKTAFTIREVLEIPETFSFQEFSLNATTERGKTYPIGNIAAKYYELPLIQKDDEIIKDILALVTVYNILYEEIGHRKLNEYYDYLIAEKEGMIFDDIESSNALIYGVSEKIISTDNIDDYAKTNIDADSPHDKKEPVKSKSGKNIIPRDKKVSSDALILADFKCEFNNSHMSFTSKRNGKQYVEAHHLIPFSAYNQYDHSIDVTANVISLCPNCHKCIHLGSDSEKKKMLQTILSAGRVLRLSASGIDVELSDLLHLYKIKK